MCLLYKRLMVPEIEILRKVLVRVIVPSGKLNANLISTLEIAGLPVMLMEGCTFLQITRGRYVQIMRRCKIRQTGLMTHCRQFLRYQGLDLPFRPS